MLITFIHISDWFWHRCSMEDEVYKPKTVRRKPWFRAVPHRCGALHLCLKLLFHFVSLQKNQAWCSNWEHLCLGPAWTVLWAGCGLLDSLLKLNKQTFSFLGVLKFGIKTVNTHINLTTGPNVCKLLYSLFTLLKDLCDKRQMLLKIGWGLKTCSPMEIFV